MATFTSPSEAKKFRKALQSNTGSGNKYELPYLGKKIKKPNVFVRVGGKIKKLLTKKSKYNF